MLLQYIQHSDTGRTKLIANLNPGTYVEHIVKQQCDCLLTELFCHNAVGILMCIIFKIGSKLCS